MKLRPILFSGPMVRALLDGTKTQTRRIMSVQPDEHDTVTVEHYHPTVIDRHGDEQPGAEIFGAWWADGECGLRCPYGQPGDRLWVRETWAHARHAAAANCVEDGPFVYAADGEFAARERLNPRWVPGIHMPRWASRITLEIVSVRVERLQDISADDAAAEGCYVAPKLGTRQDYQQEVDDARYATRCAYRDLWEQINGPGSWDANPWVWVVEFKRIKP